MFDFTGKVCFVTGGANGIGRAVVEAFHGAGARVAFCDTDTAGEKVACGLNGRRGGAPVGGQGDTSTGRDDDALTGSFPRALFGQVDVRDAGALTGFMDKVYAVWGTIDILVNNVGVGNFAPLVETTVEQFDNILATNLRSVFVTSREMALRRAGTKGYGRIINIASTRYLQSEAGTEGYAASKGGVVSLTHALAISLSGTGVTVNCISPGWIDTGHYGQLRPVDHTQHPSGRVGVPEDIARACLFLAAPENDFIDAQNLVVDGGMTKKMIYAE